jgi:hypothetical protein
LRTIGNIVANQLINIYKQMELHHPFLMRGKDVANVCAKFMVTGLKQDQNTKLKMSHSSKSVKSAKLDMEMQSKLRTFFMKHIYPIVRNKFGWLYEPINCWLEKSNVMLYSYFVSGVTAGKLFWPRLHIDPDVWFTVLVCLDYGRGIIRGGDFGFGSVGHALQCKHGLQSNTPHGTTEFDLHPNEPESE